MSKQKTDSKVSTSLKESPLFGLHVNQVYTLLFVIAAICYANTLFHGYVLDDGIVITKNIFTQQGIKGIPNILSHDTFYGFFQDEYKRLVSGGRYRPFTLILFALEKSFFGDSPLSHHLLNILIYCITGCLIFEFFRMVLRKNLGNQAFNIALITAILFVIHPVHTEVVANIKSRDELIAFLGGLAAVHILIQKNTIGWKIGASFIFLMSLLSKENAILWIPIGILTMILLAGLDLKKSAIQIIYLIVPTILFLILRSWALGAASDEALSPELLNNPFLKIVNNKYMLCTVSERWGTVFYSIGYYIKLGFWPHPLTHDYYPAHMGLRSLSDPMALVALFISIGLIFWSLFQYKKKTIWSFIILYFFISLLLVSNIFFPVGVLLSERFMYMASLSICLAAGIFFQMVYASKWSRIGLLIFAVISFSGIFKTIIRNKAWKDNYTLFTTDEKTSGNSAKINNAIGGELLAKAVLSKDSSQIYTICRQADQYLDKALSIHPLYVEAYLQKGNSKFYQKKYLESIELLKNTLTISPGYPNAITNLQLVYREAGKYYGQEKNEIDQALIYFNESYMLKNDDFELLRLMGVAYGIKKDSPKAIEFLEKALLLQPKNASVLYNLGSAYLNSGQVQKGQEYYEQAKILDPGLFN